MDRPKDTDLCGRENCHHKFGEHFTTYDGRKGGCSFRVDDQRDQFWCTCQGFAIVHLWAQVCDA